VNVWPGKACTVKLHWLALLDLVDVALTHLREDLHV